MEQSTRNWDDDDFLCFKEDEREVAEILLELPELIEKSNSVAGSENSVSWAIKKKRSAIPLRRPDPPRVFVACVRNSGTLEEVEPEEEPNFKVVQATSPATPLSFPPSESDERPECSKRRRTHNKKLQKKSTMEETVDQISKDKEVLQREIENVRRRLLTLQAENMLLKAKKKEAIRVKTIEPSLTLALALPQATVKSPAVDSFPVMAPSQPLIVDQTAQAKAPTLVNGIPDLNESVPDPEDAMARSIPSQFVFLGLTSISKSKAAAQARQRRIEICRAKQRPPFK